MTIKFTFKYNTSTREQIPHTILPAKLLKDIAKEIRHAERYINSLNPPKPERESKRKRKKPVNKDFVDYTTVLNAKHDVCRIKFIDDSNLITN